MKLRIGGQEIQCVERKAGGWSADRIGQCNVARNRIEIGSYLPEDKKMSTLLHEVLEWINGEYDLGLTHQAISSLEQSLYAFMRQNPKVVTRIAGR